MADDGWSAFDFGSSPAAPPSGGAQSTAPQQRDGWSDFDFPAPAAPHQAEPPSGAAPAPVRTGVLANAAAGAVEGGSDILNVLSDPFGNLIGKPIAVLGTTLHDVMAPMLGYHKFTPEERAFWLGDQAPQPGTRVADAIGSAMGAPTPDQVTPGSTGESLLRAGVRTGIGMAGLSGGQMATNAGLGFAGGITGEAAATLVPDEYKLVANLLGNVVGAGVPAAAVNLGRAGVNSLFDYAAPAIGRRNALLDGAAPLMAADGSPITASAAQARMAGDRLQAAATDPAAVRTTLANPLFTPLAGAEPTTFQATRDPGLGQLERGVARSTPDAAVAFKARADAQNDARVGAVQQIAAGANPAQVPVAVQRLADDTDAAASARVAALQQRAGQAADAIGGNLPAGSESTLGQMLRAPLQSSLEATRARERALWQAIDPDGTLAVDVTPVRRRAQEITRGIGPNAAPPSGEEAAILQTAAAVPDVQQFRDLTDLRSRLTDQIRDARRGGRDQEVRRLSMMLEGVHDAMAGAANRVEVPSPIPSSSRPTPVSAPSVGSEVYTPSGRRVDVRYELADAADLIASHEQDMRPNLAFPSELQPRDRDRAASGVQVARIAGELQPERLGASSTVADGAPIVGPDNVVESGNGRVLALRRVYDMNQGRADAYREWLAGQGHDTSGMTRPVLIRRRTTEMTPAERVAFAAEGNAPTTLSMSATERAAGDARRLSDDVLQSYQPGDVTAPGNRDFVRSFVRNVVEPGQEGSVVTADGALSQDGASRIRAALVHRAYGDKGLSAALSESTDPTARVLAGALQDAAGSMARLRSAIDAGAVDRGVDLAPALVEATRVVQQARQRGISLPDGMAQRDAFSRVSPLAEGVLRAAYGEGLSGRMSRERMADFLGSYARRAQEQSAAANLFGANLTAQQLLEGVSAQYGKDAAAQAANGTTGAVSFGAGDGGYGNQARGSVAGAGRQEASGGGGGQSPGSNRVLDQPRLTPNFDQVAADRYAEARRATVERKDVFGKQAPGVGQVLAPGPTAGSFATPASSVPNIIVKVGPQGADVVRAYQAAGGSPQALTDAAAYSLRQTAMRPDGTLDPAKFQAWAKQRSSFLSALPDAANRFRTAADAQVAVNEAMATRAAATKQIQDSALGKFLGDADPVTQVASVLRTPTAVADIRTLARATAADPGARAGLQRAVAEHVLRDLKGNAIGPTGAETYLKADQFQTFLRTREPALREVLTPEQMTSLRNVAESLTQSNLSVAGTKLAGGSDTAQNTAGRAETLMAKLARELVGPSAGASVGAAIGAWVGGPAGAAAGGTLGAAAGRAVQAAREAGIANVDHLVTQAMLNPALARVLLTKVTPENQAAVVSALTGQLRNVSLVGSVQGGQGEEQRRQAPIMYQNGLLRMQSGPPQATTMNSLFSRNVTPAGHWDIRQPGTVVMR